MNIFNLNTDNFFLEKKNRQNFPQIIHLPNPPTQSPTNRTVQKWRTKHGVPEGTALERSKVKRGKTPNQTTVKLNIGQSVGPNETVQIFERSYYQVIIWKTTLKTSRKVGKYL